MYASIMDAMDDVIEEKYCNVMWREEYKGRLQAQGLPTSFAIRHRGPVYYTIVVKGELAVPRYGRKLFRPTANFSRPRDSHIVCHQA